MTALTPADAIAELLALSVVEHTYTPDMTIGAELDGETATIVDTGRGLQLKPDDGDAISHAERDLTSIYPIQPALSGGGEYQSSVMSVLPSSR